MNILVTGSNGFIGKNLIANLSMKHSIYCFNKDTSDAELDFFCKTCDFVFHLAAVNRTSDDSDFEKVNLGLTSKILNLLKKHDNKCPFLISSSIQASLNNPYGLSKKNSEHLVLSYGKSNGVKVLIYRLENVFGKWCKQNYNSVIATFCYNICRDLPITINNQDAVLKLVYIDDVVNEFVSCLEGKENKNGDFCYVKNTYQKKLGEIANLIHSFKESRNNLNVFDMSDDFTKKLYSTYLSYLPTNEFRYDLSMNVDSRGSFTEFIRTNDKGQVSINVSKPGIIKGNHWHNTKNEKFLVVSGKAVIRFRKINEKEIIEYYVTGDKLQVIDIPVGYTHNIENIGKIDLVTVMWANEKYDPNNPDTYYEEV